MGLDVHGAPFGKQGLKKPPDAPQEQVVAASATDSHIDISSGR